MEEEKKEVLKLPNTFGGDYDSSDDEDEYDDETLDKANEDISL